MPLPSLAVWIVVLVVGLPSMLKNWTAVALVASWLIGIVYTEATGEGIPLQGDILRDMMVLVVIFTKSHADCEPTPGPWGWAKDCWPQLSREDKTIVCLFAPMWVVYAVKMDPMLGYSIAWSAGILQFLFAGAEALEHWRRGRALRKPASPTDPSTSRWEFAGNEC